MFLHCIFSWFGVVKSIYKLYYFYSYTGKHVKVGTVCWFKKCSSIVDFTEIGKADNQSLILEA